MKQLSAPVSEGSERRMRRGLGLGLVLLLATLVLLPTLRGEGAGGPTALVALDGGTVAVYFTTPELVYPDVPRERRPPSLERALLADIAAARRTVDLASFEYNLPALAEALAAARARGVRVRAALDRELLEKPEMARWAGTLEAAGVALSWEQSAGFLHSKFVVVDERILWTGSWNPTVNDTYRNNNSMLRVTSEPLVASYGAEFEQMAAGRFGTAKPPPSHQALVSGGGARVASRFSPNGGIRDELVTLVGRARSSVEVLAFAFTDKALGDALIARSQAGVAVRVVFERRNAQGVGAQYDRLRAGGVAALEDGNCYTMHHKVIVIDQRLVITGSYNFTGRAEELNDENLLIVESPTLAAAYLAEFERVYRQAILPDRCE